MSGLRVFFETLFGIEPTNPITPPARPVLRLVREQSREDHELLELLLAHLRDGRSDKAVTDPEYFHRKAVLFARMSTAEMRRAWNETDADQRRYHAALAVRAATTARRARRRAFELRATRPIADAVWGGHP